MNFILPETSVNRSQKVIYRLQSHNNATRSASQKDASIQLVLDITGAHYPPTFLHSLKLDWKCSARLFSSPPCTSAAIPFSLLRRLIWREFKEVSCAGTHCKNWCSHIYIHSEQTNKCFIHQKLIFFFTSQLSKTANNQNVVVYLFKTKGLWVLLNQRKRKQRKLDWRRTTELQRKEKINAAHLPARNKTQSSSVLVPSVTKASIIVTSFLPSSFRPVTSRVWTPRWMKWRNCARHSDAMPRKNESSSTTTATACHDLLSMERSGFLIRYHTCTDDIGPSQIFLIRPTLSRSQAMMVLAVYCCHFQGRLDYLSLKCHRLCLHVH